MRVYILESKGKLGQKLIKWKDYLINDFTQVELNQNTFKGNHNNWQFFSLAVLFYNKNA